MTLEEVEKQIELVNHIKGTMGERYEDIDGYLTDVYKINDDSYEHGDEFSRTMGSLLYMQADKYGKHIIPPIDKYLTEL